MPGFVLLVRPRDDGDPAMRVGITVTKKIGNAVVRNRMKRRFRALGARAAARSGVAGADHVLIGRGGGIERDFAVLRDELKRRSGSWRMIAQGFVWLAKAWQIGPSAILPPTCRFSPPVRPMRSRPARYGAARGGWLAARRIARCHPWAAAAMIRCPDRSHPVSSGGFR